MKGELWHGSDWNFRFVGPPRTRIMLPTVHKLLVYFCSILHVPKCISVCYAAFLQGVLDSTVD